jgi:hypothetical protein
MKREQIPFDKLLPIEKLLRWRNVWRINLNFNPIRMGPVPVVPYNESYVLADGHSRSAVLALRKELSVPAVVLETDNDVANCYDGALYKSNRSRLPICTLNEFIRKYKTYWKPDCEARGVKSFKDLLEGRKSLPLWMQIWYPLTDLR